MTTQPVPNITPFTHPAFGQLRTHEEDGRILFCGRDAATALGYSNTKDALARHCKGVAKHYPLATPGGEQQFRFISEGDLYRLIAHSKLPAAVQFEAWVFDEVLPAIRRTGTYATRPQPQLSEDEIVHQALQITARRVEQLEADLAKALPKANTWDALCSGRGDHSITDAAKLLSSTGIATGPRKLHKQLQGLGWIHKNQRDKWAANQDKLNTGLLAEKVRHYIDDDGVSVLATPQVRVTPKGLEKLHELLTPADLQEALA